MKIFNLAKDLNLSSETIIEFLKKKGFVVKSHMSIVTDEMMPIIMGHFKKDKEVAERHQRKLQEFRSTRKKEVPDKLEKIEKVDKKTTIKEESQQRKEIDVQIVETQILQQVPEQVQPLQVTEIEPSKTEEVVQKVTDAATVSKVPIEPVVTPEIEVKSEKKKEEHPRKGKREITDKKSPQTPLEEIVARPQKGLTIKGKIDLSAPARVGQKIEAGEKKKKKKKKRSVKKLKEQKQFQQKWRMRKN